MGDDEITPHEIEERLYLLEGCAKLQRFEKFGLYAPPESTTEEVTERLRAEVEKLPEDTRKKLDCCLPPPAGGRNCLF